MKTCKECGNKIPSSFRSDAKYCSVQCGNNFRNKKHYKLHPEQYKEKRKKDNSNVSKRILSRVKSRAAAKNIPFNLDVSDIVVPDVCPVLGIEIFTQPGLGTNQPNSPSLDRMVPELGYVKGNVRVISNRANLLKSNAEIWELEAVLEDLKCL
jgi:predicted DNA binding CopG/RHH family protein